MRFGCNGKLSPRYIGPFDIRERVGEVPYRVALPPALDGIHDVFHISQLRKYVREDQHILNYSDLRLNRDLSYEAQPHHQKEGEDSTEQDYSPGTGILGSKLSWGFHLGTGR